MISNVAPTARVASTHGTGFTTRSGPSWAAVVRRDKAFDGQFVHVASKAGIFCRPSCPSRLARSANVRFFAHARLAREAGFRACKRCRPEEASLMNRRQIRVEPACRALEHSTNGVSPEALARNAGRRRRESEE